MTRTADVVGESLSFRELLLPEAVLRGVASCGFSRPSPVQHAAIPLARLGLDLVVQAKAGTGKTLVFAVAAVEKVDLSSGVPQVLVVAPTREIALQCAAVVEAVGSGLAPPGLAVGAFIGGLPIEEDERLLRRACHVAVGTPGRLVALLERGSLPASRLSLLVLDEADKLLGEAFQEDVLALASRMPPRRQVLALSATYSEAALRTLRGFMSAPRELRLCLGDVSLLGVRQLYRLVHFDGRPSGGSGGGSGGGLQPERVAALEAVLRSVSFQQAVVFCNRADAAEALAERLRGAGLAAAHLSAQRSQLERLDVLNALRSLRVRVAVATDLAARGVDLECVNLVVNLELPLEAATYMHRVGRAGRFGARGLAVTLLGPGELGGLRRYLDEAAGGEVEPLPESIPEEWYRQAPPSPADRGAGIVVPTVSTDSDAGAPPPPPPERPGRAAHAQLGLEDVSTASLWPEELGKELPSGGAPEAPAPPHACAAPAGRSAMAPAAQLQRASTSGSESAGSFTSDSESDLTSDSSWGEGAGSPAAAPGRRAAAQQQQLLTAPADIPNGMPRLLDSPCYPGADGLDEGMEPSFKDHWLPGRLAAQQQWQQLHGSEPGGSWPVELLPRDFSEALLSTPAGLTAGRLLVLPFEPSTPEPSLRAEAAASAPADTSVGDHYELLLRSAAEDLAAHCQPVAPGEEPALRMLRQAFKGIGDEVVAPLPLPEPAAAEPPGRRPLGSAQAAAARRQLEEQDAGASLEDEAAMLEALAEEGDDYYEEEEGGEDEGWQAEQQQQRGAEAGVGAVHAAWRDFWLEHYRLHGRYPNQEDLDSLQWGQQDPAAPAAEGAGQAGMLPPPPPPPPTPLAAWPAAGVPASSGSGPAASVAVPMELVLRYSELEWREWQRHYADWKVEWERYRAGHRGQPSAEER